MKTRQILSIISVTLILGGCSDSAWEYESTLCGNGIIELDEQCDDGNHNNDDGCSSKCEIEKGYVCKGPGDCTLICGNGKIDDNEQCDDGNREDGDGCTNCIIDNGYECPNVGQACNLLCGNGRIDNNEQCDDGNTDENDGCSNSCQLEENYACPTPGKPCISACGNGTLEWNEQCDDNNTANGDGCSDQCTTEEGWICSASGSCFEKEGCGNGILNSGEECDDGNKIIDDGCSNCIIDNNFICPIPGTLCQNSCGNGNIEWNEQCDDGNTDENDGCHNCIIEEGWYFHENNLVKIECGNNIIEADEQCDDGNLNLNDGCSPLCTIMPNIDILNINCGDGYVSIYEECDDGNTNDNDGCSSSCKVEDEYICFSNKNEYNNYLPVVIRDFRGKDDGNNNNNGLITQDIVNSASLDCQFQVNGILKEFSGNYNYDCDANHEINKILSIYEKPVLVTAGKCYSCVESLDFWYTDNSLNVKYLHKLYNTSTDRSKFIYYSEEDDSENKMIYKYKDINWESFKSSEYILTNRLKEVFKNDSFLPLGALKYENDFNHNLLDQTLNKDDFIVENNNVKNNNQFTLEAKGYFLFTPDAAGKMVMEFNADDSIWVFINNKLALDFGGAHAAEDSNKTVTIDTVGVSVQIDGISNLIRYNEEYNLVEGGYYPIHIFFAERGGDSLLNINTPVIYSPSICNKKSTP